MPLSPRTRYRLERWRTNIKNLFHSDPSSARPRICPSCGSLAGINTSHCPQCGANLNFSLAAASKSLSRFLPQTSPATYFIVAVCGVLYALSYLLTIRTTGGGLPAGGLLDIGGISGQVLIRLGGSLPLPFDIVEPWRLITAIFLHASLIHIGFNLWVLIDVGPIVEDLYGSARYFFVFLFTGAFGYLVSAWFNHLSVGASGGLLGLIGLLLAASMGRSSAGAQMLRSRMIWYLVYIAIFGLVSIRMNYGTDNAAHAGGFVAGFVLGKILSDRRPAGPAEERRAQAMGWLAGLAVVASFTMMLLNYFHGQPS